GYRLGDPGGGSSRCLPGARRCSGCPSRHGSGSWRCTPCICRRVGQPGGEGSRCSKRSTRASPLAVEHDRRCCTATSTRRQCELPPSSTVTVDDRCCVVGASGGRTSTSPA